MKKLLLQTYLAKPLKHIESYGQKIKISLSSKQGNKNNTIYCISPYKTGTTYLSKSFNSSISAHEPLQLLSLKELEKNFCSFFRKRKSYLSLKLECSGYLSAYIYELQDCDYTKNLSYICVLRKPSAWVTSAINYWDKLDYLKYDYLNELFWQKKVGVDLIDYRSKPEEVQEKTVERMFKFYLSFTKETFLLNNVTYVPLKALKGFVKQNLSKQLDEKVVLSGDSKRKNTNKFIYINNEKYDKKYVELLKKKGIEFDIDKI